MHFYAKIIKIYTVIVKYAKISKKQKSYAKIYKIYHFYVLLPRMLISGVIQK